MFKLTSVSASVDSGPNTLTLSFIGTSGHEFLKASWTDVQKPIQFEDLAKLLGWSDMPQLPGALDLALTGPDFAFDFAGKSVFVGAQFTQGEVDFCSFISDTPASGTPTSIHPRLYAFLLNFLLNVDLGDLPFVGQQIPASLRAKIEQLEIAFLSPAATSGDVATANTLMVNRGVLPPTPQGTESAQSTTELLSASGASLSATLTLNNDSFPLVLPLTSKANTASGTTPAPPAPPAPSTPPAALATTGTGATGGNTGSNVAPSNSNWQGTTTWINIGKSLGPISLQRVGIQYQDDKLFFLLDVTASLSVLTLGLDGLGIGTGLSEFDPVFHLDGISVSLNTEAVRITGSLLHVPTNSAPDPATNSIIVDQWIGQVTVFVEAFVISGVAGYSKIRIKGQEHPSFFAFAQVSGDFGGPPAFFITGFMGGFGYNSKLTIPTPDQVHSFPFVAGLSDSSVFGKPDPGPLDVLNCLAGTTGRPGWLTPMFGENWAAVGIIFRSFELLLTRALLVVTFGRELEIALLGLSTLVVPPLNQTGAPQPALAVITLQLEAVFLPSQGIALVQGQLTSDSYVLEPACQLTGGFAFGFWFHPNAHSGDFVITLGGYHPDFAPPPYYPKVPRIGLNWKVSDLLTITGGSYFALTPRALMAGGAWRANLHVDLRKSGASIQVDGWMVMGTDFLVYWKPFHYQADIYIDISIKIVIHFLGTHHVNLDAGAHLNVWGPHFGGHANVYFKVIGIKVNFNVDFGAQPSAPPPLTWNSDNGITGFRESFLPPENDSIVSVAVTDGLIRKLDVADTDANGATTGTTTTYFVVNLLDFTLTTSSVIPIKQVDSFHADTPLLWDDLSASQGTPNFGIAPMQKSKDEVKTYHQIAIWLDGKPAEAHFQMKPILHQVPGGLWAETNSSDINATSLISDALSGVSIAPIPAPKPEETHSIPRSNLTFDTERIDAAWSDTTLTAFVTTNAPTGNDFVANLNAWKQIDGEIKSNTTRDALLSALGFDSHNIHIVADFATDPTYSPLYGTITS